MTRPPIPQPAQHSTAPPTATADRASAPASPRAARSREKLLRAATDLLVDAGPRAVTVDAVAEASCVAKSTLYRHWESRDEMLIDVVRCNVPEIECPDLAVGFTEALRTHVADVAATLASPEWSRIVPALMSLRNTLPELAAVVERDRTSKTEVLAAIIDLGIADGTLPDDIDVEETSALLFGPLLMAAMLGQYDVHERLAAHVVERFLASYR